MDKHARAKAAAGYAAANLIESGMRIGIGTGSTAFYFIERLVQLCHEGLQIEAIATSERSLALAKQGNIPIADINTIKELDVAVDGADEIDKQKRMIKGGGGALLREKIVASTAKEMIVIVDEAKVVDQLGAFPLPIEILPYCYSATITKLAQHDLKGSLRLSQGKPYITDNGNFIFDISPDGAWESPKTTDLLLKSIPGVLETGFFLEMAGRVIVGNENGEIRYL